MSERRLTGRDFKRPPTRAVGLGRGFGAGLTLGLLVAAGAFMLGRHIGKAEPPEPAVPVPQQPAERRAPAPEDNGEQYDFYEMLPKFEVVVPENDGEQVRRDVPAPVERPGVYVLQVGSYRNLTDAERMRGQLAKLGVTAKLQRVAVDNDVWHRVRIGPIEDLGELNRVREQLRTARVDALVTRVGD